MEPKGNSPNSGDRNTNKKTVASSATPRPSRKSTGSSDTVMKPNGSLLLCSASSAGGTVIQGFVPAGRVGTYELASGSVYKLSHFYGSRNKAQYQVTDHSATVTFSWNSELSVIDNPPVAFQEDSGPVMKLYLWDHAASEFCEKFKSYVSTPSVILVTTVNPKHLGGTLALTSMSSSRVFMDADVQPSRDYLAWLSFNSDIANKIDAEVVTKPETATLAELFSYIKLETAKVAWFECTATIDDVVRGSAWYYISCGGCNSKAVNGPTSLICNNKKCDKSVFTGIPQYLTRINVYDKSEHAVFVILGDAGRELTGKHASELVASYFECNEGVEADQCVPVPQALLDTIGQTHKFIVEVSDLNFSGKTQTITVTKVFPPEAPHHVALLEEHAVPSTSDDVLKSVSEDSGPI
ncbi:hypothetical protein Bca52824_058483 [Brassica carinata]|uniref:Replication factor A C-terminal domain-containing protein n=1 Tax=Brassica carinata TaxID=52824 RepID=A0A8X7QXX9_BRACI|nr:hypothetical protein Bca52824_058483 [Brassica carinata]